MCLQGLAANFDKHLSSLEVGDCDRSRCFCNLYTMSKKKTLHGLMDSKYCYLLSPFSLHVLANFTARPGKERSTLCNKDP